MIGQTTNLASRLQSQAATGEILLSEESRKRVAGWLSERGMEVEALKLTLKGIEGETVAYRLAAPAAVAPT